jgi:hypothetical protein
VTARERRCLDEVEAATRSLVHDLLVMAMTIDVILCECREMRREDEAEATFLARLDRP